MPAGIRPAAILREQGIAVIFGGFILYFYTPKSTYNLLIYIRIVTVIQLDTKHSLA
jgi:hypothetical protein